MPLTPSATRTLLAQLGHRPNRQLGQNFLVDGNIVRKSLELAAVEQGDRVVEIGPGLGTLTETLLAAGAEVWAIEYDGRLFAHLQTTLLPRGEGRLHLTQGDAVRCPLAGLAAPSGEYKIVANLPYAISTPWLDAVLTEALPTRLVLMVQREAAQRFLAEPGGKDFGAISIFLQSAYLAGPSHPVSRGCFFPVPDVDSRLINLSLRPQPFRFCPAAKQAIRLCFQHRRKQLGALMRRFAPEVAEPWLQGLAAAGWLSESRPEQVPVELWQALDPLVRERMG